MSGFEKDLSANQGRALVALLAEPSIEAAAMSTGLTSRTILRYLQDDAFQLAYREARKEAISRATATLQSASCAAVKALERNLECGTPSVEVRAASVILDRALKGFELEELAREVEELKRALA